MSDERKSPGITVIAYPSGAAIDERLSDIVGVLRTAGLKLAGFIQRLRERPERQRCDMLLEDLVSGSLIDVTEDRGPLARGCRLDIAALLGAMHDARKAISDCDLLVVNKFGKTEGEGGGFRPLIADAVERGVSVLIAVPYRNLDVWRRFAGDTAVEFDFSVLEGDPVASCRNLGLLRRNSPGADPEDGVPNARLFRAASREQSS